MNFRRLLITTVMTSLSAAAFANGLGFQVTRLLPQSTDIENCAFSPDGDKALVQFRYRKDSPNRELNGKAVVLDIKTGRVTQLADGSHASDSGFTKDGSKVFFLSDRLAYVYNLKTGKLAQSTIQHASSASFSPDEKSLLVIAQKYDPGAPNAWVFDFAKGTDRVIESDGFISSLGISKDGRYSYAFADRMSGGFIYLNDLQANTIPQTFGTSVVSAEFSPDSKTLLLGINGDLKWLDLQTMTFQKEVQVSNFGWVAAQYRNQGRSLLTYTSNFVSIRDADQFQETFHWDATDEKNVDVTQIPNSELLGIASKFEYVILNPALADSVAYRITDLVRKDNFPYVGDGERYVFSQDGSRAAFALKGKDGLKVQVVDLTTGQAAEIPAPVEATRFAKMEFSRDGKKLVIRYMDESGQYSETGTTNSLWLVELR